MPSSDTMGVVSVKSNQGCSGKEKKLMTKWFFPYHSQYNTQSLVHVGSVQCSTAGWHVPIAGVTWSILVGHLGETHCPVVFPEVSKLCLVFWVCSYFVHTVLCLQIPLTVPVPCKCLLSISCPLRSLCPGSLCSLMVSSSLPTVLFNTAVSIRLSH